jgi:hypothetical protein
MGIFSANVAINGARNEVAFVVNSCSETTKATKNKVGRPIGALKNSIGAESRGSLADCII